MYTECSDIETALQTAREWLERGEVVKIEPVYYGTGLRPVPEGRSPKVADGYNVFTD